MGLSARGTVLGRPPTTAEAALLAAVIADNLVSSNMAAVRRAFRRLRIETALDVAAFEAARLLKERAIGVSKLRAIQKGLERFLGSSAPFSPARMRGPSASSLLGCSISPGAVLSLEAIPVETILERILRRAINDVGRAGLKSALDLARADPSWLTSAAGLPPRLVECLRCMLFASLTLSLEGPNYSPLLGQVISPDEQRVLASVGAVDGLSDVRAQKAAKRLGATHLLSLCQLEPEQLLTLPYVGRTTLRKIVDSAKKSLEDAQSSQKVTSPLDTGSIQRVVEDDVLSCLADRCRDVVQDRYGLWHGVEETYEVIGDKLSLSRERVRQILVRARRRLQRTKPRATRVLNFMRDAAQGILREGGQGIAHVTELERAVFELDGEAKVADLAYAFLRDVYYPDALPLAEGLAFATKEVVAVSEDVAEQFRSTVAACCLPLVARGRAMPPEQLLVALPIDGRAAITLDFLKRCSEVSDEIGLDASGHVGLRRWPHFNPNNLEPMTLKALIELGEPSHFNHIAAKMDTLFPRRAPFSPHSIHGTLLRSSQQFVRVRRGTYALRNWGAAATPFIKDFIAHQLKDARRPLRIEELVAAGVARHGYRDTSIRTTVHSHPELFRRLPDGRVELNAARP